jgi:uncharacterized protein
MRKAFFPCLILFFAVFLWQTFDFGAERRWDVVVLKDVMVPMRDGAKLATDIYLPSENGVASKDKLPVVLQRTPYNKNEEVYGKAARFFAGNGYMSVIQDCRGRFNSEGDFAPFVQEPNDGYDTVQWLASHPSSNGKVGTYGVSYMGWVQFQAATQHPPNLVTMIPHTGPTNAYFYSMHVGGTLTLGLLQWHLHMAMTSKEAQQNPLIQEAIKSMRTGADFLQWASQTPWKRGQTPLSSAPKYEDSAFKFYFENYDYNSFWKQPGLGMNEYFDSFPDIPILWVTGWYEVYPRSIVDGFQAMVSKKRKNQFLLGGPWTHANTYSYAGDVNFGSDAAIIPDGLQFLEYQKRWFDRWLKEKATADIGKPVKIFMMGGGDGRRGADGRLNHGGSWHTSEAWPFANTRSARFFLHDDNSLSRARPTKSNSSTTYSYDPRNTVNSDGRCEIAYGPAIKFGFQGMGPRDQIQVETLPGHGHPGMPISSRRDVLVFQTQPLSEDVRLAGNIKAVIKVSSDAPDTDFFVKLIDVYPGNLDYPAGYAYPVTDGIIRARYREGFEKPVLMKAGTIYEISIPIQPAANLFRSRHRIRVDVSSSSFPNYDINRNTGRPTDRTWRIANNTIYHEADNASYVELPVIP